LDGAAGQRCTAAGADVSPTVHPLPFKTRVLADEGCSGIGPDPPIGALAGIVAVAAIALTQGGNDTPVGAWAAGGAIPVAGYFLGQRADQRVTTYVVTQ